MSAGSSAIKISNFAFTPATVTVKRGARVTVSNDDSTAHTPPPTTGTAFDTGSLDPGASQTVVLTKPGT
jgi:plastocyanin